MGKDDTSGSQPGEVRSLAKLQQDRMAQAARRKAEEAAGRLARFAKTAPTSTVTVESPRRDGTAPASTEAQDRLAAIDGDLRRHSSALWQLAPEENGQLDHIQTNHLTMHKLNEIEKAIKPVIPGQYTKTQNRITMPLAIAEKMIAQLRENHPPSIADDIATGGAPISR